MRDRLFLTERSQHIDKQLPLSVKKTLCTDTERAKCYNEVKLFAYFNE